MRLTVIARTSPVAARRRPERPLTLMRAWQRRPAFDNVGTRLLILCLRPTYRPGSREGRDPAHHARCLVMSGPDVVIKEETWQSD